MVYVVLVREDLQTTLEEESQVAVPSRDSSATCLCLSLRNGERHPWALPGGNLSVFWAGDAGMGSLGAGTSFLQEVCEPLCQEHRAP